ncbi:phenylacetate--CoA ligase family protein [Sporomusa sp. KB1]|uniref:phenylacetate--CoA ligase family protein n=1 Tax=Sporomusa sp. KB1 TaxID=943346 RepID=UPI0011ADBA76|nr:AMP-binding protein [Sporomusa sp. KB1]TWH51954.1 phenylacetate-CoA ligase [Sporomusa sp. KB1]
MIAETVDKALRRFEEHNCQPGVIKRAGKILHRFIEKGLHPEFINIIQRRRLHDTINYVSNHSPFYKRMFSQYGIRPEHIQAIEDLRKLPFTTVRDIRQWQDFLCVPEEKLSAVFTTSGTTGEPKRVYYTFREMQILSNLYGMALRIAHSGRLVALIALPIGHGLWIGGASVQRAVERAGGLPLTVGANNPGETIKWMERFAPNVVFSSPSYMTALTREAECLGYRCALDKIILAGELLTSEHKKLFTGYWDAAVFDSYGSTEIGSAQTIALPECTAIHLNDLHLITEIIDPITGNPANQGELVFTTIRRDGMPLIRYRSGDKARWADCACWLPFKAINLKGRTDDMIVAGDMNIYGRVIADEVGKIDGTTGRVLITVSREDLTDKISVMVEGYVAEEKIQKAILSAYPELEKNMENGNLRLAIESVNSLASQIKDVKVLDLRQG